MSDWDDDVPTSSAPKASNNDNEWGDDNREKDFGNENRREGGFRGRGRGGRGGFNRDGKDNDGEKRFGFGGERGRGRGRGRGGFSGNRESDNDFGDRPPREKNFDGDKASGEGGEEKPKREVYVPPEPSNDENEIFSTAISAGINFEKFDNIEVSVTGNGVKDHKPIESFKDSMLREFLINNVQKSGYVKPTPIQKHAIPIIGAKRDLMGCAQTGSGKTAAYCLPILNAIMNANDTMQIGKPHALIVAPTRELVIQIFDETRKFAMNSYIKVCRIYGGVASGYQSDTITQGCHILVATPGRLQDFVDKALVTYEDLKFLVLDEADRMLDMGFRENIEKICSHPTINKENVTTLMFSATFPEDIQLLANKYLRDYIFLTIGVVGSASSDVEQEFMEVTKFKKRAKLTEILDQYCNNKDEDRILVFVETKRTADFLASLLSETKISSTSIHGDRLQREREEALRDFRTGKRKVLIATAVAARGLDIKGVTHVINYDLPKSVDEYVHRIGRTGRVGNRGKATSFYDSDQDSALRMDLIRILKNAKQPIPAFLGDASNISCEETDVYGGTDIRQPIEAGKPQADDEDWD